MTLELFPDWGVYAIPLSEFDRLALDKIAMLCVAHEEDYALEEVLHLEIAGISFENLGPTSSP